MAVPKRTVKALILAAPGVNCDRETVEACRMAGAEPDLVHLNTLLAGERRLDDYGFAILPGGFSYGDHLGAGTMLAAILRRHLLEDLLRFVTAGKPLLGICNGFQILARLGLLGNVTLAPNSSGSFICRWVTLRVYGGECIFMRGLEEIELPIAHGQGRVVMPEESLPDLLSLAPLRYGTNPNGSTAGIAGVCNRAGTVLGLMPHPERYLTPFHHPRRQSGEALPPLGLRVFQNAVQYARGL
ncbi:MAG: phosphoribosylformylglycinamidine synthase I [Chloroflexota bacterium]|nr:phosphoribosylformylglycinamidine synthase I [Chloroflexota bacterium]